MTHIQDRTLTKPPLFFAGGLLALVCAILFSITIGMAPISLHTTISIVLNKLAPGVLEPFWRHGQEIIIWELRLPRTLLAALVGAGLGIAGAAMQGITRNPMADPHLLGVSAGAALGANIAMLVTGDVFGLLTVPLFAFAGALAATFLVIALVSLTRTATPTRLILAGIAISFVISSLTGVLTIQADPRSLQTVIFWMLGGLGLAKWDSLPYPLLALFIAGVLFFIRAQTLNALAMGDETASSLGIHVGRQRVAVLTINAFLTGILVAFSGMIGFVGLMMPHIVRALAGGNNRIVLPGSALLGAIFLVLSDILARTLLAPSELPVGIVTGVIGGLFFILLLRK